MAKDYYVEELEQLIDCKIVGIVRSTDKYEKYYGLKIDDPRMERGLIIWFLRDEEGNGPGSFTIENYDEVEDFEEI
jgi:hypothetical protein